VVKLARAALLAAPLLAAAPPAAAHVELSPTLVNRYFSLMVTEEMRAQIVVSLLHGDLPAVDQRRAMDANHDGRIDETELEAERRAWQGRSAELLEVALDGRPLTLEPVASIDLAGEPRVTARALVVELVAWVPLARGQHAFTLTPGRDRPRAGETEVTVDLDDAWSLLASRQAKGADTRPPQRRFTFSGPRASVLEDRAVTFVIAPAVAARADGVRPQRFALVAAALMAAGLGLALWLRRRRR